MISSAANPRVQRARRLTKRVERERTDRILVEGRHVLTEALRAGRVEQVLATPRADAGLLADARAARVDVREVTEDVMAIVAATHRPPSVLGVVMRPRPAPREGAGGLYIAGVRDPSTVGALIALAAATGSGRIVVGPHSADPFSPKAVRAGAGAHFRCSLSAGDDRTLSGSPHRLVEGGPPAYGLDLPEDLMLAVGPETGAQGWPTVGAPAEGFNPSLALQAAGVLYEWVRQRQGRTR